MNFTTTRRTVMQQTETSQCGRYCIESNWLLDGSCTRVAWFKRDQADQQRIAEGSTEHLIQACIKHKQHLSSQHLSSTTPKQEISHD